MSETPPLRLTILGSGDAFSGCGCNAAYLVHTDLLVDCGAPVQVLLPRAGASPVSIDVLLLTHFHADHTFMLPVFLGARAFGGEPRPGLVIAGPPGTREYVLRIVATGYGNSLAALIESRIRPRWVVMQDGLTSQLASYAVTAHAVTHSTGPSLAYTVSQQGGVTLGFSGDSTLNAGLRRTIAASDVMVCECTGWDEPAQGGHLWKGELDALIEEYPRTRFVLSHLGRHGATRGAVVAHDLLALDVARSTL
ncbi:MAG: MBL fold metallo-hydrolase [Candidatus Dormibacteria bacterium]